MSFKQFFSCFGRLFCFLLNFELTSLLKSTSYDVLSAVTTCVEIYGFSVYCLKLKIEPYFTF
jgi:hypothetical protein